MNWMKSITILIILFIIIGIVYTAFAHKDTNYDIRVYDREDKSLIIEYNEVHNINKYDNGTKIPGGRITFKDKNNKFHDIIFTTELIIIDEV